MTLDSEVISYLIILLSVIIIVSRLVFSHLEVFLVILNDVDIYSSKYYHSKSIKFER